MTRPDGFGGPPANDQPEQWRATAPYPQHQPQPPQHQYAQDQYAQDQYAQDQYAQSQYAQNQYAQHQYAQDQYSQYPPPQYQNPGPQPPYQPYQQYGGGQWPTAGQQFLPGPPLPGGGPGGPNGGRSGGKIAIFAIVGVLLLGLIGGGVFLVSSHGLGSADRAAAPTDATPTDAGASPSIGVDPTTSVVTVALPTVIDGHQQLDNKYAQQLVETLRQQLAATSDGSGAPVAGIYTKPGEATPAFLVAASTTNYDPELLLTGLAAGMQQAAGAQEINFVDQPAGPLGGTMRCAENGSQFTVCIWGVDGAFGMNMVYGQDVAQSAATTLRVREAVEIHS